MPPPREASIVPALGFAWLTPFYDTVLAVALRERRFRQALLEQATLAPGHAVLDVGCGTGSQAIQMQRQEPRCEVTGIDADPAILAIARKKAHAAAVPVRFDRGNATELPYSDNAFDRVTSSLLFHHLLPAQKREAAAQALRVLRPGGTFHVVDWGRPSNAWLKGAFGLVRLLDGFENTGENVEGRLGSIFMEAGFVDVARIGSWTTALGTVEIHRASKSEVIARAP